MAYRALLDANVLVPARVRDVLLTLADIGLFIPLWSSTLLDEVARHLPDSMDAAARAALVGTMARAFPEADVEVPARVDIRIKGDVNAKDQHVVAAALLGGADVIVTEDRRLHEEIERLGHGPNPLLIDAQRVDTFVGLTIDIDAPKAAVALVSMARRRWLGGAPVSDWTDDELLDRVVAWCERNEWTTTSFTLGGEQVRHSIQLSSVETSVEP